MNTANESLETSEFNSLQAWTKPPEFRSIADVEAILGIPANRILASPAPGFATEQDCERMNLAGIGCELRGGYLLVHESFASAEKAGIATTLADVQAQLFNLPAGRLYVFPAPGSASLQDCEDTKDSLGVVCELYDGVLVGKSMGYLEGRLAQIISHFLETYLDTHPLGITNGPDGTIRLLGNQVRAPDVSFVEFARIPEGGLTDESIPHIIPNLAVEILSKSNRRAEMERKLNDYFAAGVQLVWYIDAKKQTATVYRSPDSYEIVGIDGILTGGHLLPGFELSLAELFAKAAGRRL